MAGVEFFWYFNHDYSSPWWVGETWFMGDPVWQCENLFYLTLTIEYQGQSWSRVTAAQIYWQELPYGNCTD